MDLKQKQAFELLRALLELTSEQNDTIKRCNKAFKNVILLLDTEYKQLETNVNSMHARITKIEKNFKDIIAT